MKWYMWILCGLALIGALNHTGIMLYHSYRTLPKRGDLWECCLRWFIFISSVIVGLS